VNFPGKKSLFESMKMQQNKEFHPTYIPIAKNVNKTTR
jgi:hypothetical protein